MEHLMAFESVNSKATEPPFVKLPPLETLVGLRERLVEAGKLLLVRAYPGPLGQPLDQIGGLDSPHLPAHHRYQQPTTNLEVQQAMKDLLNFPLAVYLCAFADEGVYLSYSMWYSVRQAVPCPLDPESCQWPLEFPALLSLRPGAPGPASWQATLCSRTFHSGLQVTVDLADEATGDWSHRV
jgi:hypothetical protein